MDQGLTGHPREECADDVHVDDIREGVASLGEPTDVIPQGLTGLLLAALEVLGVSRADIRPVAGAVVQEELEPCSNMFPHTDGEVLNDEVIIIPSSSSTGEPEVFKPYIGIRLPGIFGDVGRRSEALWERHSLDAPAKGPGS